MSRSRLRQRTAALGALLLAMTMCRPEGNDTALEPILGPAVPGYEDENWAHQLNWILWMMNGHASEATDAEIAEHVEPQYLARVSMSEIRARLDEMGAVLAPFVVHRVAQPERTRGAAFISAPPGPSRVVVDLDPETGHIHGWTIGPYMDVEVDDIVRSLSMVVGRAQLLVAELDGATCRPLYELNPDEPLAIASVSKLYTLLALARYVAEGNASWQTPVAINDAWKAPGSGKMQLEPAGTVHTLRQLAEAMVKNSDNTAADHILRTIGRERVEQAVIDSGGREPFLNIPFLSAGEWCALGRLPEAPRLRYLSLPSDEKRRFLERELTAEWSDARGLGNLSQLSQLGLSQIGPYASSTDLCNLAVALWNRRDAAPVVEMLALHPSFQGSGLRKADWPHQAAKGGSFLGAKSLVLLLQRQDGRVFFVSVAVNDTPELGLQKYFVLALAWRLVDALADE